MAHSVKSSNVASIDHDGRDLIVNFHNGSSYRYTGVPTKVFDEMKKADSVGSFLHNHIKSAYRATRIDKDK